MDDDFHPVRADYIRFVQMVYRFLKGRSRSKPCFERHF